MQYFYTCDLIGLSKNQVNALILTGEITEAQRGYLSYLK